ncbi:DNA polymerase epsilon catalytic [Heracleum sosnowskyi]|uniref:DNA polymerase epsilon catalytic n=1 Tax=Heracleum sosnowskyi TaxID=360622 RepID=A0AAD8INQ9_9APIA|nr:DNA polymerase epsilon catalytic [Heracleum sosnowskyi]
MGSLMAGWSSTVQDPTAAVIYRRNHSLTREDIDTYWKSKKLKEEEPIEIASEETGRAEKSYQRSSSVPLSTTKERFLDTGSDDNEGSSEKLILKSGWWMRSNSAFLNEPPVLIPLPEGTRKHQHI